MVFGKTANRCSHNKRKKQHLSSELAFPRDEDESRRNSREVAQEAFCHLKESKKTELQVIWEELPYLSSFKDSQRGWAR